MYYFIIRFWNFYHFFYRLHFVMSVLHFAKSFSNKSTNFAPDKNKNERKWAKFECIYYTLLY